MNGTKAVLSIKVSKKEKKSYQYVYFCGLDLSLFWN